MAPVWRTSKSGNTLPSATPHSYRGIEVWKSSCLNCCCETSHSLGSLHVLVEFPHPEPKSCFAWLPGARLLQPFVWFEVSFCPTFLETSHTLHTSCCSSSTADSVQILSSWRMKESFFNVIVWYCTQNRDKVDRQFSQTVWVSTQKHLLLSQPQMFQPPNTGADLLFMSHSPAQIDVKLWGRS